ncbi:MAG: hypothetical protein D6719_08295 [Candidatus Dadabacteria bacterium]|nr:MAG: hypothetical protein D6719_08295 [Candidatus Dadabacteria bacterium]
MKLIRNTVVIVTALFLTAGTAAADASRFSPPDSKRGAVKACKRFRNTIRRINLSDEQKTTVADLLSSYLDSIEPYSEELSEARKNLYKDMYLPEGDFDEQLIRVDFQATVGPKEEITVLQAGLLSDLHDVLNPVQYMRLVKARVHLYNCTHAPIAISRRVLGGWIDQNGS